MLDIERIYSSFIDQKQEERNENYKDFEGWFGASSAGHCHKKQYYKLTNTEAEKTTERVSRLLRLGTIVHKDIEQSILAWNKSNKTKIQTEKRVTIPELKVVGHVDILEEEDNVNRIYDFKTVASYKWKKKFGRFKNRDKNADINYKLQLGTYGLAAGKSPEDTELYLIWYNKDNSSMKKPLPIDSRWMNIAKEYWEKLKHNIDMWTGAASLEPDELKEDGITIPLKENTEWECNLCQYYYRCGSKYNTKQQKTQTALTW
tara:strand:- start:24307 stop:25086 length:780 start_codon:yes stop_codon:yes gene_type:complete